MASVLAAIFNFSFGSTHKEAPVLFAALWLVFSPQITASFFPVMVLVS